MSKRNPDRAWNCRAGLAKLGLICCVFLLDLVVCPSRAQALETREFVMPGTNRFMIEAPAYVQVIFDAMRFNERTGEWNVDVTVTNAGPLTFGGVVILSVDGYAGTSGPMRSDGFTLGTPGKPHYQLL